MAFDDTQITTLRKMAKKWMALGGGKGGATILDLHTVRPHTRCPHMLPLGNYHSCCMSRIIGAKRQVCCVPLLFVLSSHALHRSYCSRC